MAARVEKGWLFPEILSRLWIPCSAAGCGGCRIRKPLAFPAVDFVEKGHGWLFPQIDSVYSGLFMAWYMPVLLLVVFRPNLENRVALTVLDAEWFPKKRRQPPPALFDAA